MGLGWSDKQCSLTCREQGRVGRAVSSFELSVGAEGAEEFDQPKAIIWSISDPSRQLHRTGSAVSVIPSGPLESTRASLGRSLTAAFAGRNVVDYFSQRELGDVYGALVLRTEDVEKSLKSPRSRFGQDGAQGDADIVFSKAGTTSERLKSARAYVGQLSDQRNTTNTPRSPESARREGFGVQLWRDGARYEGQWTEDAAHGLGRFTFPGGHAYTGEWRHGKSHGLGTWQNRDGQVAYAGEWHEDRQHGLGVETWDGGTSSFGGEFLAGNKQGHGVYARECGTYSGGWRANTMHGPGHYMIDGTSTEMRGHWEQGRIHGPTRCLWRDEGQTYEGQCVGDAFEGFGVLFWVSGSRYEGFWRNGVMHGMGSICEPNGCKTMSRWIDGRTTGG